MRIQPSSHYLRRSIFANGRHATAVIKDHDQNHIQRVRRELEGFGLGRYAMRSPESHYLPYVIRVNEHLGGVTYGWHEGNLVMMVATDQRIIFLDKKPLFISQDDITYDVVSGVSFAHAGIGSTVTLHTRIRDYKIRSFSLRSAEGFVRYIELHCMTPSVVV